MNSGNKKIIALNKNHRNVSARMENKKKVFSVALPPHLLAKKDEPSKNKVKGPTMPPKLDSGKNIK